MSKTIIPFRELAKRAENDHVLVDELEAYIAIHLAAEGVQGDEIVKIISELEERAAKRVKK